MTESLLALGLTMFGSGGAGVLAMRFIMKRWGAGERIRDAVIVSKDAEIERLHQVIKAKDDRLDALHEKAIDAERRIANILGEHMGRYASDNHAMREVLREVTLMATSQGGNDG